MKKHGKINVTKSEKKVYFWIFISAFVFLMGALIIDNIFWVNASPEWETPHTVSSAVGSWTGGVIDYSLTEKIGYILGYRVFSVLTNLRDLSASLVFALVILSGVMITREIRNKRILKVSKF